MARARDIFIRNLTRELALRGITQKSFATALGIGQGTVSKWLSGDYQPSFENIDKICRFLQIDVARLFDDRADGLIPSRVPDVPGFEAEIAALRAMAKSVEAGYRRWTKDAGDDGKKKPAKAKRRRVDNGS